MEGRVRRYTVRSGDKRRGSLQIAVKGCGSVRRAGSTVWIGVDRCGLAAIGYQCRRAPKSGAGCRPTDMSLPLESEANGMFIGRRACTEGPSWLQGRAVSKLTSNQSLGEKGPCNRMVQGTSFKISWAEGPNFCLARSGHAENFAAVLP